MNYFGESAKTAPPSVFFPVFVRFVKAYKVRTPSKWRLWVAFLTGGSFLSQSEGKFPGFRFGCCQSVSAEQGRALAASGPQDVVYSPRPNNRKDQLGLTLELQLQCLDWFYHHHRHPLPSSTPGQPRPAPAPSHSTLPMIVLILDLWDLLQETCNTRISAYVCLCLFICNLKEYFKSWRIHMLWLKFGQRV